MARNLAAVIILYHLYSMWYIVFYYVYFILQIVNFICVLVDAHYQQLVLSPDSQEVLINLHQTVETQVLSPKQLPKYNIPSQQNATICVTFDFGNFHFEKQKLLLSGLFEIKKKKSHINFVEI